MSVCASGSQSQEGREHSAWSGSQSQEGREHSAWSGSQSRKGTRAHLHMMVRRLVLVEHADVEVARRNDARGDGAACAQLHADLVQVERLIPRSQPSVQQLRVVHTPALRPN
eukprot:8241031-Pyramimonas_sp.AAC.1